MPKRRDPNFKTGHLCRFCGELVPWGSILRLIRVDPDTPGYMLNESACHTECLRERLRPDVPLTFHRHWQGRTPLPNDDDDIFLPLDKGAGVSAEARSTSPVTPPQPLPIEGRGEMRTIRPCAMCAKAIAPADLVRLRVQKPVGPIRAAEFDERTLPLHFECLAAVSTSRLF